MGFKKVSLILFVIGCVAAQNFKVCVQNTDRTLCNSLDREGQAICEPVESRIDCAIKLSKNAADFGVFTEEETLLLAQQQPNDYRVVATVRDVSKAAEPYAFQAVAIVANSYGGTLESLRGAKFCHPGLDHENLRWSPRVQKAFEQAVARTDRCPDANIDHKSADEQEADTLNQFFSAACRLGQWSANNTVDEVLKSRYPNLCSLCGSNSCAGYTLNMGVNIAGVNNDNRHIQALECLRSNGNGTVAYVAWQHVREFFTNENRHIQALECLRSNGNGTVAYVAWQHVREFFTARSPEAKTSFSLLCPDGSAQPLTDALVAQPTAPCAFVNQPWSTIVASASQASTIQSNLRTWWPNGANPGSNTWQGILFNGVVGGASAVVNFEGGLPSPANYTSSIRNITNPDATGTCFPTRRWCTLSTLEHSKCTWLRLAAYSLGIQPMISCQQRNSIFDCLKDIKENQADFIASASDYGYVARKHYSLSPVKLVQNSRSSATAFTRVAAFVKESAAQAGTITRFENLRGKKACFPEYGGISYVAFLRAAHERGVVSATECDYAKAVGEFFDGACAPGALDAAHALDDKSSSFNSTSLCSVCKKSLVTVENVSQFTCSWDNSNLYFGNNGSLACLNDPSTDIAVLQVQNISTYLTQLNLQPNQFRALCRNNSLAVSAGVAVDDNCLLAHVVDAEVLARRSDTQHVALSVLLDTLDKFFGYTAEAGAQLINMEIFSPFDGVNDLLFKDSAIGFSEPSTFSTNEQVRNYIELYQHLESCSGTAPTPGMAHRNFYSILTLVVMALMTRVFM